MPNIIPIPVLSTVAFSSFLSSAPTTSIESSDSIFFLDNSGNLKKINANNFINAVASNFIGNVGNFDSATTSGYYQINSSGTSNGPGIHGGEKYPGVLEVTNMGSSVVRQIARISTNGYSYRDLTLNNGSVSSKSDWIWIPYSAANGVSLASASANGLMSSVQFTKLNNLTTGTATTGSNGYMTSAMVNNLTTAYNHASSAPNISSKALGFYKVGYNANGHITTSASVAKSDLNNFGLLSTVTATNTTRANQTPDFGNTFNIYYTKQDANAKITEVSATVKIPNTVATQTSNGLMPSTDRAQLKHLVMERLFFPSGNALGWADLQANGDGHWLVKVYQNDLSNWGIFLIHMDGTSNTFHVKKVASNQDSSSYFFNITTRAKVGNKSVYRFSEKNDTKSLTLQFLGCEGNNLRLVGRHSDDILIYPQTYSDLGDLQ